MSLANNSLAIEFLSEELPPIKLETNIGNPFSESIYEQLSGFLNSDSQLQSFVAPRRFGCVIRGIDFEQADQQILRKGPAIATGLKDGAPTPALLGFAKSCNTEWQNLEQRDDGYFYFTTTVKGKTLDTVITDVINNALRKIHIAKAMRWGSTDYQFVRPLHSLIVMFNDKVLNCEALGLSAGNTTSGHRFMNNGKVTISDAASYLAQIKTEGNVVAEFGARKELINAQLNAKAQELGLKISPMDGLLDEVTALVEWPEVLVGSFDEKFLKVPQECLILSMAKNQKYFALVDDNNKLNNKFLFVSNLISKNPQVIIEGNQKVLTARLADAEFFYEFDKRTPLADFVKRMANVVYHNKLGSQLERVERLQKISSAIAPLLNVNSADADRAAYLLKADLVTEMVGEFPELQGIMGNYYAIASNESKDVANAIEKHYYPRFSGDELPDTPLATVVSLADKLETLVGIWGIGLIPTGDKDPYALRRAALGIVRILLATNLDVKQLLNIAYESFTGKNLSPNTVEELYNFIVQRLANYLTSVENYSTKVVNSILLSEVYDFNRNLLLDKSFVRISELLPIIRDFSQNTQNNDLFQANKRVENILKKNVDLLPDGHVVSSSLLQNQYEIDLFNFLHDFTQDDLIKNRYKTYFDKLSQCSTYLANFFENTMVIVDDISVCQNRLALLKVAMVRFGYICKLSELA